MASKEVWRYPKDALCALEDCDRGVKSKGLCHKHYEQLRQANLPPCRFPGCGRNGKSRGLCAAHWYQDSQGWEELKPVWFREPVCENIGCDNLKQERYSLCSSCRYLRYSYGLTLYPLKERWKEQGRSCACCGLLGPEEYSPCREWVIDHDHGCCPSSITCGQCVRGIVCHPCNTRILTEDLTKEKWLLLGSYLGYVVE